MEKINGVIIDGKFYEAVEYKPHEHSGCRDCCFYVQMVVLPQNCYVECLRMALLTNASSITPRN